MWTPTTRRQHSRAGLRYGSDLTDAEWTLLAPFLPAQAGCGRKRAWLMHEIVNAICYVLRGGVAWRLLPSGFPPWRTIYRWFSRFRDDGTEETVNHHLAMRDRERVGREASPTAAVIDSQSVKSTESGGVRGFMPARRSRAASATPWSILTAGHSSCTHTHPTSRTATELGHCCGLRTPLGVREAGLRGRGLSGAPGREGKPHPPRDRAQTQGSGGLCRPASALGGRAVLCLDQPRPPARQGFRSHRQIHRDVPLHRVSHPASAPARSLTVRFETDSEPRVEAAE